MMLRKLGLMGLIILLVGLFYWFELGQYLVLDELHRQVAEQPLQAAAVFFGAYVLMAALSLPAAALLTLAGGAVFGLWQGLVLLCQARLPSRWPTTRLWLPPSPSSRGTSKRLRLAPQCHAQQ